MCYWLKLTEKIRVKGCPLFVNGYASLNHVIENLLIYISCVCGIFLQYLEYSIYMYFIKSIYKFYPVTKEWVGVVKGTQRLSPITNDILLSVINNIILFTGLLSQWQSTTFFFIVKGWNESHLQRSHRCVATLCFVRWAYLPFYFSFFPPLKDKLWGEGKRKVKRLLRRRLFHWPNEAQHL